MKSNRPYEFAAQDMERVFACMNNHKLDLEKHRSWLQDGAGKALPGAEIVVQEITKEIQELQKLILDVYQRCFTN